jgi:hypothetical protein
MNTAAHAFPASTFSADATWTETHEGHWTVTLGDESRAISKDGSNFIAWIGHRSSHWCFARALKACVDDIEYRLAEAALAQAAHDEAIASLMRMTGAEKARLIAKLEQERDWLDHSDAHVDVVARKAQFDRQIATLRAV